MSGYKISEETAQKIGEYFHIVNGLRRRISMLEAQGRPAERGIIPYRKAWYRIVTNEGEGKYTVRFQEWATKAGEEEGDTDVLDVLEDISDPHHPEYGLDQDAWDFQGRTGGVVDQLVPGWQTWVNDHWYLVIDVGEKAGFWVKIESEAGLGVYDEWTEQVLDASGAFVDADNPRTEEDGILVEVNATEGIPTGTYAWVHEETEADGEKAYRFSYSNAPPVGDWYIIKSESSGVYTANRVYVDHSSGDWEEYDPAQTVSTLKEANGIEGVSVDTVVWVQFSRDDEGDWKYRFAYQRGIQFYKVSSDYSEDDDTVTAHPCDYDGGNVDTETTVTCYIESPWANSSNMPKRDVKIKANAVVAGFPFGTNKAMLLPLPPRVPEEDNAYVLIATTTSTGAKTSSTWIPAEYKYQVLQVKSRKPTDATDSIGFDYIRFVGA